MQDKKKKKNIYIKKKNYKIQDSRIQDPEDHFCEVTKIKAEQT